MTDDYDAPIRDRLRNLAKMKQQAEWDGDFAKADAIQFRIDHLKTLPASLLVEPNF